MGGVYTTTTIMKVPKTKIYKILKELTATFQDEDKKGPNSKKRNLLTKSNIYMNQPDCSPFLNQITFSIQLVI